MMILTADYEFKNPVTQNTVVIVDYDIKMKWFQFCILYEKQLKRNIVY